MGIIEAGPDLQAIVSPYPQPNQRANLPWSNTYAVPPGQALQVSLSINGVLQAASCGNVSRTQQVAPARTLAYENSTLVSPGDDSG